jgi:hypothetical protein
MHFRFQVDIFVHIKILNKVSAGTHAYDPSFWEAEIRRIVVPGQ